MHDLLFPCFYFFSVYRCALCDTSLSGYSVDLDLVPPVQIGTLGSSELSPA